MSLINFAGTVAIATAIAAGIALGLTAARAEHQHQQQAQVPPQIRKQAELICLRANSEIVEPTAWARAVRLCQHNTQKELMDAREER